jgi:hypothetical protein
VDETHDGTTNKEELCPDAARGELRIEACERID